MILLLNSFSFSFSHSHVQTCRSLQLWLDGPSGSFLRCGSHWAPLSTAYLDELIEEDLIILVNCQVLLIGKEIFRLLSLLSISFQLLGDHLGILNGLVSPANARHFLCVRIHFSRKLMLNKYLCHWRDQTNNGIASAMSVDLLSSQKLEGLTPLDICRRLHFFFKFNFNIL